MVQYCAVILLENISYQMTKFWPNSTNFIQICLKSSYFGDISYRQVYDFDQFSIDMGMILQSQWLWRFVGFSTAQLWNRLPH